MFGAILCFSAFCHLPFCLCRPTLRPFDPASLEPAATPADPTLYAAQLQSLSEMGFGDTEANVRALVDTSGNVQLAIERLLISS